MERTLSTNVEINKWFEQSCSSTISLRLKYMSYVLRSVKALCIEIWNRVFYIFWLIWVQWIQKERKKVRYSYSYYYYYYYYYYYHFHYFFIRAFLCVDEPAVKATFAITLIILAHHTALSNMPESSVAHIPGGKKKVCVVWGFYIMSCLYNIIQTYWKYTYTWYITN